VRQVGYKFVTPPTRQLPDNDPIAAIRDRATVPLS